MKGDCKAVVSGLITQVRPRYLLHDSWTILEGLFNGVPDRLMQVNNTKGNQRVIIKVSLFKYLP